MFNIDFTGKNVYVSGGARGLGAETARAYAECGADVFVSDIAPADDTVASIQALGRKSAYASSDVCQITSIQSAFDQALDFFGGKIDIIQHNAGVISVYDFLEVDAQEAARVINVNVMGVSNILQIGLRYMIPRKAGNMVIMTSIAGRNNAGGSLEHYCASKAAANSLVWAGATKGAKAGIRVNAVAPGIIRTPMWEDIIDGLANGKKGATGRSENTPEQRKKIFDDYVANAIPMGCAQTERDIANGCLFLASDYAKSITGEILAIDGGSCMY